MPHDRTKTHFIDGSTKPIGNDTNATVLELADKIAGPLPQRVVNIDTGEKSDEYRVSVSAAERDLIVTALRGNAALEAALNARTSELYPDLQAEIEQLRSVVQDMLGGLAYLRSTDSVPYGFGIDRLEQTGRAALAGTAQPTLPMATPDRTAIWSNAVEACAKVAENYVPGPAGHPYEHVKHDICVGVARKLRSLYLSPERVREVYPDPQKPSHAEQTT
jgi:hypothetical protein